MEPKSSKNASKCKMKRYQKKKEPIFDRFLVDLGSIWGGFWAPKSVLWGPKSLPKASLGMPEPQRSPKSAPRSVLEANLAPFWLHLGPTWRHFGSILAQLGAFARVLEAKIGPRSGRSQDARRRPKSRFLVKFWCFALTTSRLLPQCSFMILILSSPIIQTRVFRAFRFTACRSRFVRQVIGETSD